MRRLLTALIALLIALPAAAHAAEDPEKVILKLDQFLDLYEKTKKRDDEPPRDHAIASARYSGEVIFEDGKPHSVRFKAKMRVSNLKAKGWARMPILPATVALQSAKIGAREAPVVIEGGFYTLVTDKRGDFDLDLVFGAAVKTAEGSSGVEFQLTPSGATELQLAVPVSEDLDFTVTNAKLQSDKVVGKNRVVEATIPATGSLAVQWQREIPEAEKKDARVYTEIYTLTSVGDGALQAKATIENTILFAGVEQLTYDVPKGMTVLAVEGNGIRDWKLSGDKLEVLLNFAAEGNYSLTVDMERPLAVKAGSADAPILAPIGVERAKGWVGIESRGNLEISAPKVQGATPVDVRSLPASILGITDQPVLLGFKYLGAQPSVALKIADHEEVEVLVTLLDQTVARTMWTPEGRRLTSVQYQVRNNRRQFLKLDLPKGATLWSASVGGRAVQPAKAKGGQVMVPLIRSQAASGELQAFHVEVVYVESGKPIDSRGKGKFAARLPTPDVPSTYVAWTVYSPEGTKIRKRSYGGSLQQVEDLSRPVPHVPIQNLPPTTDAARGVEAQTKSIGGSAMAAGAAPVLVKVPLKGVEAHFEKLLALDENLEVRFDYRGLRKAAQRR